MRFAALLLTLSSISSLVESAPYIPKDGKLQRSRRRGVDYPLEPYGTPVIVKDSFQKRRKRSVPYSVVPVDGGASAAGQTATTTVVDYVTASPATQTVLVTHKPSTKTLVRTKVVTTTDVPSSTPTVTIESPPQTIVETQAVTQTVATTVMESMAPIVETVEPVTPTAAHSPASSHKPSTHKPSTHKTSTHKASTHKASTHKPSIHKTSTHKTSTHKPSTPKASTHKVSTHEASTQKVSILKAPTQNASILITSTRTTPTHTTSTSTASTSTTSTSTTSTSTAFTSTQTYDNGMWHPPYPNTTPTQSYDNGMWHPPYPTDSTTTSSATPAPTGALGYNKEYRSTYGYGAKGTRAISNQNRDESPPKMITSSPRDAPGSRYAYRNDSKKKKRRVQGLDDQVAESDLTQSQLRRLSSFMN